MEQYPTNLTDKQWQVIEKIINPQARKQHIIVDTQGNLMAVAVHEANVHDSKGAPEVIGKLSGKLPRLVWILADGGYRGNLADWILNKFRWELEVVLRPDECTAKFKVLPKRWIVERGGVDI